MTTNISLKMKKYSSEKSDLDQKLLDDELDEILELAKVKFKFEEDCKAARGFHRLWLQYIIAPTAQEVHSSEELKELEKRGYGISAKWLVWFTIQCGFMAVLIYFTYSGTASDQQTKYLSLDYSSVASGDKESNFRICYEVPLSVTGKWTLDSNGYWSGKAAYKPGYGVYTLELNGFSKTQAEYKEFLLDIKEKIAAVATNALAADLSLNLASWMSWGYRIEDSDGAHVVRLSGQPSYVFDRFYKSVGLIDPKHQCFAIPDIFFDKSTGNFLVQYAYSEYTMLSDQKMLNYPTTTNSTQLGCCFWNKQGYVSGKIQQPTTSDCMLPPVGFGYKPTFDASHFSIRYNINSLMTAYAVNMGLLPYEILSEALGDFANEIGCTRLTDTATSSQTYGQNYPFMTWSDADGCVMKFNNAATNGVDKYVIEMRIDPKFSNMDPIYCLTRTVSSDVEKNYPFTRVCLLRMGDSFVYPFFNHMGTSGDPTNVNNFYNVTKGCSCGSISALDGDGDFYTSGTEGSKSYCDRFDLMHGFVIINSKYADVIFSKLIKMAMAQTAKKINIAAYFPAFGAIRTGGNAGQNKQDVAAGSSSFNDLLHLMQKGVGPGITSNSPFSFCKDDTNGCVIFAMNTYDTFDQRINKDFYDLTNGNCFDSFSISDGSWFNDTGAYNVPPQQLTQDYYECYNQIYISLMAAFGSASGSASAITPVWTIVLVYFVTSLAFGPSQRSSATIPVYDDKNEDDGLNDEIELVPGVVDVVV